MTTLFNESLDQISRGSWLSDDDKKKRIPKPRKHKKKTAQEILEIVKALPDLPDAMRVKLPVVCAIYSRSSASVWRDVQSGRIPEPCRDGTRNTYWTVGSLRRHLGDG